MSLQNTISTIILLALAAGSIFFGLHIDTSIQGFCHDRYGNSSFLERFEGDEPPMLKICLDNEDYGKCLYENTNYDEYKFVTSCGWMNQDYLNMAFQLICLVIVPFLIVSILISVAYSKGKQRRKKSNKRMYIL